jgi:hypothetical protein
LPQITRDSEERQNRYQQHLLEQHRRRQEEKMRLELAKIYFEAMGGVVVDMNSDVYGLLRSKWQT